MSELSGVIEHYRAKWPGRQVGKWPDCFRFGEMLLNSPLPRTGGYGGKDLWWIYYDKIRHIR